MRKGVVAGLAATGVLALGGASQIVFDEPLGSSSGGGINVFVGNDTIPTPTSTPTPDPDTANLWVSIDGDTDPCTRSSSPASYDSTKSCTTLDAALDASSAGDTVGVKDGSYGTQTLSGAKASLVTFFGESKAGTTFTGTVNLVSHVKLQDLTIHSDSHSFYALNVDNTTGVRLDNVDMEGDYVSMHPEDAADFQWVGGLYADHDGVQNKRTCSPVDDQPVYIAGGSDILIEDVFFGDTGASENGEGGCVGDSAHIEMVRADGGVDGLTIRKNVFMDNGSSTATIFLTDCCPALSGLHPRDVKIVGNFIGDSNVPVNWGSGTGCGDVVIAYNTLNYLGDFTGCSATSSTRIVGNVASKPGFAPPTSGDALFTANVMQANGNISYVGTWVSGPDFSMSALGLSSTSITGPTSAHLQAGSAAINAGETPGASDACTDSALWGTSSPTDIDGDARPTGGSKCDAGADEYTGG